MSDINSSDWSETDSANTSASPNGWASGTLPNQVEPISRATMGAVKRYYNRANPTATSAGTANAQTLTYTVAPSALVKGDTFSFTVGNGLTNTGAVTLNINSLGATAVQCLGVALVGGEMPAGAIVTVNYDGTHFQLTNVGGQLNGVALGTVNALGGGAFSATTSYTGGALTKGIVGVVGSTSGYVSGQAAVAAFQKFSSDTSTSGVNQTLYVSNQSNASGANVRATAIFGEAILTNPGSGNFNEGGRFHGIITGSGAGGQAEGVIGYAQSGSGAFNGLFGFEGVLSNNYQDTTASNFTSQLNGAFLASPNGPHILGAAYIVNPNDTTNSGGTHFLYGLAAPLNGTNANNPIVSDALIFTKQASTNVIDASGAATGSNYIKLPNNAQIRINDSGGNPRNIMTVDTNNLASFAADGGITNIQLGSGATVAFDTGADTNFSIGPSGAYTELLFKTGMGITGGATADKQMYFDVPSGGLHDFRVASTEVLLVQAAAVLPASDNAVVLGSASKRWSNISSFANTIAPATAPSSPASGWVLYVDSGDSNKLKAKASTGTVVTLGTP